MKRSVAIYGPTPQFVRWAIGHACPLRDLECENLPDRTFRQLRSLREYSIGVVEDRVFENICVHPESTFADSDLALGFHEDEVLAAHGGAAAVEDCCGSCPANALSESRPDVWAGCYGWLPATSGFCLDSTMKTTLELEEPENSEAQQSARFDFVRILGELIENNSAGPFAEMLFMPTKPRWYGLWENQVLTQPQVGFLHGLFESAVSVCVGAGAKPNEITDLIQFRDALKRCFDHQLTLHIDLVPPGYSDGTTWTLAAHCPDCKSEMSAVGQRQCLVCGRTGNPHGQRKSKVLGLRPYVNLTAVIGAKKTAEFMQRFESRSR